MLKENLVILRNIHGYSQEEIAEKINISRQAYAKWETGATVPDIEKCSLLAAVYGVTIDSLIKTETADGIGAIPPAPKGKNIWGSVTVSDRGQIVIPKAHYAGWSGHYIKYAMRNAMDIATLGTSVNARLSPDGKTFERVRIAFGVAGPVPMRAVNAEAFINGRAVTLENIEAFGRKVLEDIHPRDSWRASKAFRSHIAVESAKRCLIESVKLAGGVL